MTQLVAEEAAAVGGDPVVETVNAEPEAVEQSEVQPESRIEDDMYPDDRPGEREEDEGEQPTDEEDGEPDKPAIAPPNSWKAEDKERWDAVPREVQEIIARRETEFTRGITEKAREVEKVKAETVTQAASEIAEFRQQQAQTYQQLAALIMPEPPDQRLAFSDDPQHHVLYNQQRALWENAVAQQQQLQQAAQHEASEAQRIERELEGQAKQADDAKLREAFPEWFDETDTGKKVQSDLKTVADELGYTDIWDHRNAADVLALRKIAEWKTDAQRWRSHDRNRRHPNGTYRAQRQLPPISKPGSTARGTVVTDDPVKLLYPND